MDGISLIMNENGQIEGYKKPYATIECVTEEDYKRLEYLVNLGKAVEKAFKFDNPVLTFHQNSKHEHFVFTELKELLEWAESEGKK